MVLVIKDNDKGKRLLKALQKPQKARRLDAEIPNGLELIERLERKLASLQAKLTELETTNRNIMKRVFELETKIENLRGGEMTN
jgi:phage shock protein A